MHPFVFSRPNQFGILAALVALAAGCREAPIPEKTSSSDLAAPPSVPAAKAPLVSAEPTMAHSAIPAPLVSPAKPSIESMPKTEQEKLSGFISYISERDGQREVYVSYANGSKETRLTDNKYADYNGPFSPDGKALLVMRVEGEDGPHKLYWWPLDGSAPKRLGPDTMRLRYPNFTPDGKFIVFESSGSKDAPVHFCDLFRIDVQGKKLEQLTHNDEGNFEPTVSPRGDAIVHVSSRDRVAELYAMKVDGTSPLRLTQTTRDEWGARFSSDGSKIAFISDREGAERIWIKDFPEGQERRLTHRGAASRVVEDKIAWAPSGKKIAYVLKVPDNPTVVVIFDLETGKETILRGPQGDAMDPSWSPDGRHLAVTANDEIWIVREDGKAWVQLTQQSAHNWNPIWGSTKLKQ